MKRLLSLLLAVVLCFGLYSVSFASAPVTLLQNEADRNVVGKGKLDNGKYGDNPIIDGVSPTTGLAWNGYYQPMLVQIDNSEGGIGAREPWGGTDADIVYETPLYKNGSTRISFLFSDVMPSSAGPVRSARVGHCWMREEWQAGFIFYGTQELKGSSCSAVFRETGADKKGVLFSGLVGSGKPWYEFLPRVPGIKAPNNVDANVKAIADLIPKDHLAIPRPWLFTDELPTTGDFANKITIDVGHKEYNSSFLYDDIDNLYYRYVHDQPYLSRDIVTKEETRFGFKNVIIQRAKVEWNDGNGVAPITHHIGKGNADFFIGGRYIPGYWERPDYTSRTVYMDMAGNEIQFQRGKTFILVTQNETPVAYSSAK